MSAPRTPGARWEADERELVRAAIPDTVCRHPRNVLVRLREPCRLAAA